MVNTKLNKKIKVILNKSCNGKHIVYTSVCDKPDWKGMDKVDYSSKYIIDRAVLSRLVVVYIQSVCDLYESIRNLIPVENMHAEKAYIILKMLKRYNIGKLNPELYKIETECNNILKHYENMLNSFSDDLTYLDQDIEAKFYEHLNKDINKELRPYAKKFLNDQLGYRIYLWEIETERLGDFNA